MELPTLYTNGDRYWKISVIRETKGANICREYGKVGGKAIINKKLITIAKSCANAYDQAVFEAQRDWIDMKTKKGYKEGDEAQATQSPISTAPLSPKKVIIKKLTGRSEAPPIAPLGGSSAPSTPKEGGLGELRSPMFLPMLANKFLERKKYVKYPCMAQPKLDGVRYTARKVSPTHVMVRTRCDTECHFFEEIKSAIQQLQLDPNVILDGEFYSKRVPFKTLNGYCNRKKLDGKTGYNLIPHEDLESIHYYIFDCYFINGPTTSFGERFQYLSQLLAECQSPYLKLVPVTVVQQETELMPLHNQFVEDGYEGLMVRNISAPYKIKDRSNDLLKYKNFFDTEFTIVGAKTPLNGKEEGCIIWELKLPNADGDIKDEEGGLGERSSPTFTCRPRDTYESRKADWGEYQSDPQQFIGKPYTVRYQETYDNGIPRFPVGIAIRYDLS